MPLLGKQLITPDTMRRAASPEDTRRLQILDTTVFLVMHALSPGYKAPPKRQRRQTPAPLTTELEDRPAYRHPSQTHNYDMQASLQRAVGGRAVGLSLQERELVDILEEDEPEMLAVGSPLLKVVTTGTGGADFPGESTYLFTIGQHIQTRKDTLETLRLFNQGDAAEVVDRIVETQRASVSAVYDHLGFDF